MKVYQSNHINKVIGVTFIGFKFEDSIASGGEVIKLGLFRVNNDKVVESIVKGKKTNQVIQKKR